MNVTTETRLVFNLVVTEEEAQEGVQDPKLIVSALRRALSARGGIRASANGNGNGKRPKYTRNMGRFGCSSCERRFAKRGGLERHQAREHSALAAESEAA